MGRGCSHFLIYSILSAGICGLIILTISLNWNSGLRIASPQETRVSLVLESRSGPHGGPMRRSGGGGGGGKRLRGR